MKSMTVGIIGVRERHDEESGPCTELAEMAALSEREWCIDGNLLYLGTGPLNR